MGMTKPMPPRYRLVLAMGVSDPLPVLDTHHLSDAGMVFGRAARDFLLLTPSRLATKWLDPQQEFRHFTYTDGWLNLPHTERLEMLHAVQPNLTNKGCNTCRDNISEMIADLAATLTDPRYTILMDAFDQALRRAGMHTQALRPELAALAQKTIEKLDSPELASPSYAAVKKVLGD